MTFTEIYLIFTMAMEQQPKQNKNVKLNELNKTYTTTAHSLKLNELAIEYKTNLTNGLTTEYANKKLLQIGYNELTQPEYDPKWIRYLKSVFGGFFNILLWVGAFLCFISYVIDREDITNLYLGFVLADVVALSGSFEFYQESTSADLMGSLSKLKPENVVVIRNGKKQLLDI